MSPQQYVILRIQFRHEDQRWLARCVELGTSTFGSSLEEAQQRISEAILLHLNTLEEVGERERFFESHRIKVYSNKPPVHDVSIHAPLDARVFVQPRLQPLPAMVA